MVILSWWTVKRKGLSNLSNNSCLRRNWFFDPVWFCSLDLRRGPNYNTIGETGTSPKCKAPVVFCIHGNKFGVVKCCDNLDEAGASARNEDNAKLTGTLIEVSDEDVSSSRRNRRASSGMFYPCLTYLLNVPFIIKEVSVTLKMWLLKNWGNILLPQKLALSVSYLIFSFLQNWLTTIPCSCSTYLL